jgi:hypothetical protein
LSTTFGFFTIAILESLPDDSLHTARQLFTRLASQDDIYPHVTITLVRTAAEFFSALEDIHSRLRSTGQIPLIHIETHGAPEGLQLASKESISWREVLDRLRPINITCRLNLFVSFASCRAEWIVAAINPAERAPFWGFWGPRWHRDILEGRVEVAFQSFFQTLIERQDLNAALRAVGGAFPMQLDSDFAIWCAEYFFLQAFRAYVLRHSDESSLLSRAADIAAAVGQADNLELIFSMKERLRDFEHDFNRSKERFFMFDICPANRERFTIGLDHLTASLHRSST